jgi:hypothetical protein
MTDWLWSLATSWALWVAVAVLLVALVVGYLPFLDKFPIIGPYVKVARFVAFLTFGLVCALLDRRSADARAEIAQLKRDLSFAELQISNNAATADEKARLAAASLSAAAGAQLKANTYEQWLATRPGAGCALGDDDLARMQDIKPRRAVSGGTGKAVGQPLSRLRGFGERLLGAGR